jgi:hypothetical protein
MAALEDVESLARSQAGCVTRSQARGAGLSISHIDWCVASGRWAAPYQSVYVVDAFTLDHFSPPFVTRLGAAILHCGMDAVACLESAAHLHGLPTPTVEPRVQICLPPGAERHQRHGVELHFRRLQPDAVVERPLQGWPHPIRCTSALQTAADALRTWAEWESVSLLDAALAADLLPEGWMDAITATTHRRRGAVAARDRARKADARSQSPLETRVRLIAVAHNRPPDHLQLQVRDTHGVVLGYGDMAWELPGGRVLIAECDGRAFHEGPAALLRDRRRANDFSAVGGVDVVRFTWEDTLRPAYIRHVLDQHLSADAPRNRSSPS